MSNDVEKEIKFTCPVCGKMSTLSDWLGHNTVQFNKLIDAKVAENFSEKEKEIINKKASEFKLSLIDNNKKFDEEITKLKQNEQLLKVEYEKQIGIANATKNQEKTELEANYKKQIADLQFKNQNIINELKQMIKDKEFDLSKVKNSMNSEIENSNLKIKNEYIQEITNLKNTIEKNENNFNHKINEIKFSITSEKNDSISKVKEEYETKMKSMNEKITQLELKNAENRILQNKTKGENWENEVENQLRGSFGYIDKIEKITKSIDSQKADYLQIVRDANKRELGKIVYELKNAKWSDAWIPKLVQDVANSKAKYGILVANNFSEKFHLDVGFVKSDDYENIWITDPWSFIFVAQIIRKMVENEFRYSKLKSELLNAKNDDANKQYIEIAAKLENYMKDELPKFIKSFNKQISDLGSVENSLKTNASKVSKIRETLQHKFNKEIKEQLEAISKTMILDITEEESQPEAFLSKIDKNELNHPNGKEQKNLNVRNNDDLLENELKK